ncbi:DUF6232 family protein [Streptomyces sp. 5.8]|uniref:DUF6232 family protein n=1 Tax=Streptomyces sp. 5.8 TaxID=3406571 RepID=UPI003BB75EE7
MPPVPRSLAHAQGPDPDRPGWSHGVDEFGVTLRVSRRLLWVGEAVYPLHNVVRVRSFVLKPNRTKAVVQFGQWMAVVVVTLGQRDDLRRLVRRIVDAIERPENEFAVYVHQLQVKLGD